MGTTHRFFAGLYLIVDVGLVTILHFFYKTQRGMNINDAIPLKLFIFILGLLVAPVFVVPGSRSQYLLSRLYRPTAFVCIVGLCNRNPSSTTSLRHRSTHGVCLLNLFLSYLRDIKICGNYVTFHLRMSSSESGS